ncbi:hypothetical protein FG379_000619 [Cryptosporidium bovis]|uniref:uncharacterized protein n=1 Tax=Cryptosporidium bovis TaxID=310047 RepID=UPI00351A2FD5|nr:hypothetical protein FG379_000619 [Cryptosporidium bovis]
MEDLAPKGDSNEGIISETSKSTEVVGREDVSLEVEESHGDSEGVIDKCDEPYKSIGEKFNLDNVSDLEKEIYKKYYLNVISNDKVSLKINKILRNNNEIDFFFNFNRNIKRDSNQLIYIK